VLPALTVLLPPISEFVVQLLLAGDSLWWFGATHFWRTLPDQRVHVPLTIRLQTISELVIQLLLTGSLGIDVSQRLVLSSENLLH
jgi:hypothetical protein